MLIVLNKLCSGILTFILFIHSYSFCEASLDTIDISAQGSGWGLTKEDALKDAIRNAVETSCGLLIGSETVINNYIQISDQIITSANAYCKSYEVLNHSYDPITLSHNVQISAIVSRYLLNSSVKTAISQNTRLDLNLVELELFKMRQQKQRLKSAVLYLANYIQNDFKNAIAFSFDSVAINNQDIVNEKGDVSFVYSIRTTPHFKVFAQNYSNLRDRIRQFADNKYDYFLAFTSKANIYVANGRSVSKSYYYLSSDKVMFSLSDTYVITKLFGLGLYSNININNYINLSSLGIKDDILLKSLPIAYIKKDMLTIDLNVFLVEYNKNDFYNFLPCAYPGSGWRCDNDTLMTKHSSLMINSSRNGNLNNIRSVDGFTLFEIITPFKKPNLSSVFMLF